MGVNKTAESPNITKFEIYPNTNGQPLNVLGGVSELYIYESMLDWTVRASATFADTGKRIGKIGSSAIEKDDANLTAGEKVHLVVEDNQNNKLSFVDDYQLQIAEVKHVIEHTQKVTYMIDFQSKEFADNLLDKSVAKKRYNNMKISDMVRSILTSDSLGTSKNLDIDQTLSLDNLHPHIRQPFGLCTWLAKRSIPEGVSNSDGVRAGYLFYETANDDKGSGGYHFKSIDLLFTQDVKKRFILNNTNALPQGYDAKILDYSFDSTVNLTKKLKAGSLSSELRTFNPFNNEYREPKFSASAQFSDESVIGGLEKMPLGKSSMGDLYSEDNSSARGFAFKKIGTLVQGKTLKEQLKNSTQENIPPEKVIKQAKARYNNLFSIKLSIGIPGDLSLHVGDLVYCDFPDVSDKVTPIVSEKKGGIYMIVDICHLITTKSIFTRMNLVRESIYRKPM